VLKRSRNFENGALLLDRIV